MNKLMIFPLLLMVILTMISFITGGNLVGSGFETVDINSTSTINGSSTSYSAPNGGVFSFDLFTGDGLLLTIIALSAVGIIAGIQLFGSGLSEFSQHMIVTSVGFIGLWVALTIFAKSIIMDGTGIFGILIYFALTILYGLGFLFNITGGTDG